MREGQKEQEEGKGDKKGERRSGEKGGEREGGREISEGKKKRRTSMLDSCSTQFKFVTSAKEFLQVMVGLTHSHLLPYNTEIGGASRIQHLTQNKRE